MTEYLNERETSTLTGRAISTLQNDRAAGRGFPYVKWGRFVRYPKKDVIAFMEARKVQTIDSQGEIDEKSICAG
jgi:hypothetical protein